MTILLTGFSPFHGVETNPSQWIVEHFAAQKRDLITAVLPTEYAASGEKIRALIREHQPDVVLSLGVAQSRTSISLERVALNLNDTETPDNAGDVATGRLIEADAPLAYWSTLPLDALLAALKGAEIPAAITNHAGAFVCNHVFFSARHEIERASMATRCGFVHVPAITEGDKPGLSLAVMIRAVELCIEQLAISR